MQGARRIIAQGESARATIAAGLRPCTTSMMNFKRTATIALVGAVLIAWLAGAATTMRTPLAIAPAASNVVESADALASEIARLHERLHPTEPPQRPARNLFAYRGAVASR